VGLGPPHLCLKHALFREEYTVAERLTDWQRELMISQNREIPRTAQSRSRVQSLVPRRAANTASPRRRRSSANW
jgi:hypothetical protein